MTLDEIISIEELYEEEMIDIEVSGNHLFFANDILTHNSNGDVDLTNTSESMGITHTADAIFALVTSEELEELGQLMIKQLKNRWGDLSYYRRFTVGIDRAKMKIFNLEASAQVNVQNEARMPSKDDGPVFDKSEFAGKTKKRGKNFDFDDGALS